MATKNDATGERIKVTFGGAVYTAPPAEQWGLDVLEAIDDGKLTHAVKALIGTEQYAKFRRQHSSVSDLGGLFEAIGKATNAGNS